MSHPFPVAVKTEPLCRWWVERRLQVVAQKGDRIPLDVTAAALWAGLIFNRKPETRHLAHNAAHFALENKFGMSHVAFRGVSLAPRGKVPPVAAYEGGTDEESEDRTSVIATSGALLTLVLR